MWGRTRSNKFSVSLGMSLSLVQLWKTALLYTGSWLSVCFVPSTLNEYFIPLPPGLPCFAEESVKSYWGYLASEELMFNCCFKDFLLVSDFEPFYYDMCICGSLCFYPIWSSLSFLNVKAIVFIKFGKFSALFLQQLFFSFLFLLTVITCIWCTWWRLTIFWGSVHCLPAFQMHH